MSSHALYLILFGSSTSDTHDIGGHSASCELQGIAASAFCGSSRWHNIWLWLKALQLSETTDKVSNLVYFAPFISLLLLHFIIDEPVYYTTPVGLLLIIGSVIYQNRSAKA
jgi:drug/metabolite transporter (DMT)-like permease